MSEALETAYASATATPVETYEFRHRSLPGGSIFLAKSKYDVAATLESSSNVTFLAASIDSTLPGKSGDGGQSQSLSISNVDGRVWAAISKIVMANRATSEEAVCIYRPYLLSDTSAPAGAPVELTIKSASVNRSVASIQVAYSPLPNVAYPRTRYYPDRFPWLKYL